MNWDEVFKLLTAIVISLGGSSALVIGLSSWLGKVWASRILEKDRLKYSTELEIIKNQLGIESQKQQLMFSMYFQGQFKLYNDLWLALSELQDEVDQLWNEASELNLRSFVKAVQLAKKQIKNNAILIEQVHYKQIMDSIISFENYIIGKKRLINISKYNNNSIDQNQINELIEQNLKNKQQIDNFIEVMLNKMRTQIGGGV